MFLVIFIFLDVTITANDGIKTHVVFYVWLAASQKENPARLVVSVLAAEVKGCEPAPVLDVGVGLGPAENTDTLTEALPCRFVEGRVPVDLVLMVHAHPVVQKGLDHFQVTLG